jgi:hypothetical protein
MSLIGEVPGCQSEATDLKMVSMSEPPKEPVNPYASPQIDGGYSPRQQNGFDGLWRDGDVLVMHKDALLPPICVKSGLPATEWLQRDLLWQPPWVVWTIVFFLPVYIFLSVFLSRKATIVIGLSRKWGNLRRLRMLMTAGIAVLGFAVGVGGLYLAAQGNEIAVLLVPIGLVGGLIVGTAYGQYACRLVWPKKISSQFVWLRGVHPDFLKLLPPWPGGEL